MDRIALKIQRRRFFREAVGEIAVYQRLRERAGLCPEIVGMREAFLHDSHVCMAFEKHGNSLEPTLDRGAIAPARVRRATRQILRALDHLHRSGYTHTDVKPGNILYSARSGDVRLGDLGDADDRLRQGALYGTREYTSPEVILGAPLTSALDIWNLGCTVFEMFTGQYLFNPRAAAAKKYREFSEDGPEMPLAASVLKDNADEEAEQLAAGDIIAQKYRLERALGRGRFSTVWTAKQLSDVSLDCSDQIVRDNFRAPGARRSPKTGRARDRAWRHKKGAADLLDLALHYEQLLLMAALCGPFPQAMVKSGRYQASYFEEDGELRFRPVLRRASLRDRLRRQAGVKGRALDVATDFLRSCLTIDPGLRMTAAGALAHPWLLPT
jgi:serine/threonine protein kinase